jgi:hypothetical protein
MTDWTFYPAFLATIVSIIGLSRIAVKYHDKDRPRSLSELGASEQLLLVHFRNILLFCGSLFAITVLGFIAPRAPHTDWVIFFGSLMVGGELLAAIIPARKDTIVTHNILAYTMAVGMLGLAIIFWIDVSPDSLLALLLAIGMSALGTLTMLDKTRFLFYELGFVFASHFSILIAAIALH